MTYQEVFAMKNRVILALALAAALAGCSSVPLGDVPVEDKTGTAVPAGTQGPQTQSQVATVRNDDISGTAQGPANVSRLVYFDFDSYSVKPEYQSLIEQHARFLKTDGKRHVVVEGHTDDRGGREYNLALGQRRAEAVRRALGLLGVGDNQVEAVSFGKEKPADPGTDEAARAKNRRAEITYRR
jgi:peptidoglycan-associated lipoprotein